MVRLIKSIIFCFCLFWLGHAEAMQLVAAKPPAAAGGCPSATYMFATLYTGSTDETGCFNSGASSAAADSTEGTYSFTDNAIVIDNNDERFTHDVSGDDLISEAVGTLWMEVKVTDGVDTRVVFESYVNSSNYMYCRIDGDEKFRCYFLGAGTSDNVATTDACTVGDWTVVGYSWQESTAGNDHAVTIGNTWAAGTVEEDDDLGTWNTEPDDVTIGENDRGITFDEEVQIRNVYITSGYKDVHPNP